MNRKELKALLAAVLLVTRPGAEVRDVDVRRAIDMAERILDHCCPESLGDMVRHQFPDMGEEGVQP